MLSKSRKTKETDISVSIDINGSGKSNIDSGVAFLDHMLESFSKHSLIDLDVKCSGDTHIDDHHSVEDIGIVMGQLFAESIYPVVARERFGSAAIVMDEALVSCDLDISNRAYLHYELGVDGKIGTFDIELAEEFFRAFVMNSRISTHIVLQRGKNRHHIVEAAFKSLAVALRRAMAKNDKIAIPSTKDML